MAAWKRTFPLMSLPAYSRAGHLPSGLPQTIPKDDFQSLCLYNAESNVILKAMKAAGEKLDLTKVKLYPCVVPDRGVSKKTMDAAIARLKDLVERNRTPKKRAWWKFW